MPLYQRFNISPTTTIILWRIEETEEQLKKGITLHSTDMQRLARCTNPVKRNEFLALRQCLKVYFGGNPPVFYNENGKPLLKNGYHVSFSHTQGYAGMIVCRKARVGIDLEISSDRIRRIARKFLRPEEKESIEKNTETEHLTLYWGAKEVMVKITGNRRLHFIGELAVAPFSYQPHTHTTGLIRSAHYQKKILLFFKTLDKLHLTYGWEEPTGDHSQH